MAAVATCPNGHAMDEGYFECPACGAYRPSVHAGNCRGCGGTGTIEVPMHGSWEEHGTVYAECTKCHGSGRSKP